MIKTHVIAGLILLLTLAGCQSPATNHPLFSNNRVKPITEFSSFDQYLEQVANQLSDHRYFLTEDRAQEIKANLPFELQPTVKTLGQSKGILLIHGLGDSPWSFVDIGRELAQQGYLVRTVLLPGHGTRPGDMLSADHRDWRQLVNKQVELLKKEVDQVYLGGFSTGANLAYLQATEDKTIKGLMLFSPGFKSDEPMIGFTPILAWVKRWLIVGDAESETNYTRYNSMPTNGFVQYYHTSKAALDHLEQKSFKRPVFIALSEDDSVLDSQHIRTLFKQRFNHPQSRLLWFSTQPQTSKERVIEVKSKIPDLMISNMSHMGIMFSPQNPYYGIKGSQRFCRNGQEAPHAEANCNNGAPVWFSAWGLNEADKIHARLTFNPYFEQMMGIVSDVFQADKK